MRPASTQTAVLIWLFATVIAVAWAPSADGDIWWHLAAGREMVRTHGLLWTDPFSSGAAGRPWIDVHWLFQLAAYAVFAGAGLAGLVLAKALLVATGALVLFRVVRGAPPAQRAPGLFAALLVVALFAVRHLLLVRPVIPTLLFVAITFHQLERFRRGGGGRALLWLPALQILWSNVQGLAALGPALVAAYLGGAALAPVLLRRRRPGWSDREQLGPPGDQRRRLRPLLACLGACLVASLITPFGIRGPLLAWQLFRRLVPISGNIYSSNIAENVPPWSAGFSADDPFWHLRWFMALLAISFVVGRRRLSMSHLLIAVGLGTLAVMANRNVLLLYWVTTPIVAMNLAPAWRGCWAGLRRRWRGRWVPVAAASATGALLLALAGLAAAREPTIAQPAPWRVPIHSTDVIASQPGPGTIFAADNFGGYLIWRLYPRFRPYIDTRLVLRTADEFWEYLSLADNPASFDGWERPFRFDYVLLPSAYPDRYLGLIAHLADSPSWKLIFTDGTEVLFARPTSPEPTWELRSPATTDRMVTDLDARFGGQPRLHQAARLQLASLLFQLGHHERAEQALADLTSVDAEELRARTRLALGDEPAARSIAERLLKDDPRDVPALNLLALLALKRNDRPAALSYLRRALDVAPHDSESLHLLSQLEQEQR